jgi:hypothetical protein
MKSKLYSYKGLKIEKPANISGRCIKRLVELGLTERQIQAVVDDFSKQLAAVKIVEVSGTPLTEIKVILPSDCKIFPHCECPSALKCRNNGNE